MASSITKPPTETPRNTSAKQRKGTPMSELIERALADASDTKIAIVGAGAIDQVAGVFRQLFGDAPAIVVGDERTMAVAGNRVLASLRAGGVECLEPYVFPGEPELYAKYENCEILRDALRALPGNAVAVGAGTLNDIVKRASSELGRQYLQVGTAASMDGYTAFGGSIALNGFKNTLDCPAPAGSISDLTVMAAAPQAMTASGYGDLLGKIPAGADWMLADALGVEPIDPAVWEKVVEVNVVGVYNTARAAVEQVIANRGHMVLIASVYAHVNGVVNTSYAVSKAGVESLGRALRTELEPHGASAGVAYFGYVETELIGQVFDNELADAFREEIAPSFLTRPMPVKQVAEALINGIGRRESGT